MAQVRSISRIARRRASACRIWATTLRRERATRCTRTATAPSNTTTPTPTLTNVSMSMASSLPVWSGEILCDERLNATQMFDPCDERLSRNRSREQINAGCGIYPAAAR